VEGKDIDRQSARQNSRQIYGGGCGVNVRSCGQFVSKFVVVNVSVSVFCSVVCYKVEGRAERKHHFPSPIVGTMMRAK